MSVAGTISAVPPRSGHTDVSVSRSETMKNIQTYYEHENGQSLYEFYVEAECLWEKYDGSYRHDAACPEDYNGVDEVYIEDFKVVRVDRYVDGVMVDFCDDEKIIDRLLSSEIERGILCAIEDEVRSSYE